MNISAGPFPVYIHGGDDIVYLADGSKQVNHCTEIRDPLSGAHRSRFSEVRVNRPKRLPQHVPYKDLESALGSCNFEPHRIGSNTPRDQQFYPELYIEEGGYIPVSVCNLYGHAPLGRVNYFTSHQKRDPQFLTGQDFANCFKIWKKHAIDLAAKKIKYIDSFVNFGPYAGASQEHPHSQDSALSSLDGTRTGDEFQKYFEVLRIHDNPFQAFFAAVRNGEHYSFETKSVFVMAPIAPRYPHQIDLFMKPSGANSFAALDDSMIDEFSSCMAYSINFLTKKAGVHNFNVDIDQAPLLCPETLEKFAFHAHICPRDLNVIAGCEQNRIFVVDVAPQETAKALREYKTAVNGTKLDLQRLSLAA